MPYPFEETLSSSEIKKIRRQVKEDQKYPRRDRRKMRRELHKKNKEGAFHSFNRGKVGKWISENFTSSNDFRYAYCDKRAENDYYDTWGDLAY